MKLRQYLLEAKDNMTTLPKNLDRMSDKDIESLIEKTAKMPNNKISKNQDIVNKQMDKVHSYLTKNHGKEWMKGGSGIKYNGQDVDDLLKRLSIMKEIYAVASDVKNFGSKPKDWVDKIKMYINRN